MTIHVEYIEGHLTQVTLENELVLADKVSIIAPMDRQVVVIDYGDGDGIVVVTGDKEQITRIGHQFLAAAEQLT
jgi:hypothetical protein